MNFRDPSKIDDFEQGNKKKHLTHLTHLTLKTLQLATVDSTIDVTKMIDIVLFTKKKTKNIHK